MNINEILNNIDTKRLQQLITQLSKSDKRELLKKLDGLSDADIKRILNGR